MITQTVGSAVYLSAWNPDFLFEELGIEGTCARYYPEKRTAVDVGNPASKTSIRKAALLTRFGFRYLCLEAERGKRPE